MITAKFKINIGLALACVLFGTAGTLSADDLNWGNTYVATWSGFGTSPYTAVDTSQNNLTLNIFCLDFNDEIAPPASWQAGILPLNQTNVTSYAQFGGNYNNLLAAAAAPGATLPPPVSGAPFAFTGDSPANPAYNVSLAGSVNDPYTRYLEAAWLFSNIQQSLLSTNGPDVANAVVSQVAAWDLFVESQNQSKLAGDISGTGGAWTFNNYVYSTNYSNTAPGTEANLPQGLNFEEAVDEALNAAQNAISSGWATSQYFGTWNIVTGTPGFVDGYGLPVQEFLTPTPGLTTGGSQPPVPEPAAIFLLGSAAVIMRFAKRKART